MPENNEEPIKQFGRGLMLIVGGIGALALIVGSIALIILLVVSC